MEPPSPLFILKKSAESITDLFFWDAVLTSSDSGSQQVNVSVTSSLLAGYSNNGGIDVWNLETRRIVKHFDSDFGIISVCGTKNCEIISLNREGELKFIDAKTDQLKFIITVPNVGFCKAACLLSEDELLTAVTGEETSSISIWDLREKKLLWRLIPTEDLKLGMVMCIKIFRDSKRKVFALGAYEDGSIAVWRAHDEVILQRLQLYSAMPVMCMDFNSSIMVGVAGSPSDRLTKFSLEFSQNGNIFIKILKIRKMQNEGVADIKVRHDCKIVAAGGWSDGSVRVFSLKSLKPLAVLKYHDGTVQSIAFNQDEKVSNQVLASGSETHKIALWSIYNDL